MFDFGLGKAASTAILALFVTGTLAGGYFLWESRVRRAAIIEAQRDALIELAKRQAATTEQRNKTDAIMRGLPDDRVRLCAVQGPESPCCTPDKECKQ